MYVRVLAMIRKEFIQVFRDRRTLAMLIVIPVIWLVAFGYAVTFDVKHVNTAVVDHAHTSASQALIADLRASDGFTLQNTGAHSDADLEHEIKEGTIAAGVVIPSGYGASGPQPAVQVLVDGSDLFASQGVLRNAQMILQKAGIRQIQAEARAIGITVPITIPAPSFTILYNPQLKSSYVMIPALIGLVMAFIATLMTALGVARERERGTLEQLIVTPIRPFELMLGKVLPYMLIAAIDFLLIVALGLALFAVPLRGSFLLLVLGSLFFLLAALGIGLLVSTLAQNQQQAMQLAFFTIFPQFIFSGFVFPLAAIPWGVRWIGYIVPLTYFLPITRGVFLKDIGLAEVWPDVLVLAVYGIGVLTLAALRFRKRLS
jgi:ABC-2 type transport system permease protein